MVQICEVKTKKQKRAFASFPLKLYKGNPYYVPSLWMDESNVFNPKKNNSLKNCEIKGFLAYKDGKLVGRIAGVLHHQHEELTGEKNIRFSRFDCTNDLEVSRALLDAVKNYGKENGMEKMHGPWGFNDQDREGMLIEGFDRRATYATNYNYEYYPKLIEDYGFETECTWEEYEFKVPAERDQRIHRIAKVIKDKYKLKDLCETKSVGYICKNYGQKLFDCVNAASVVALKNYVPVEGEIVQNVLDSFAIVVNRRFASVVVNEKDEVVGVGVVLSDITPALIKNRGKLFPFGWISMLRCIKYPKKLEMAMIAVRPDYQKIGVNAMVIDRILGNIIESGIKTLESNPELEYNRAVQSQWKDFDTTLVKKRRAFIKEI